MRVWKHLKVNFHILNSGTSRCFVFSTVHSSSSFLFLDYSTPPPVVCLSAWPRQSRPHPFPSPRSLHLACSLSFLSICSAVRRWVDFNELFDERLSLVRRRVGGGRMEEKHHLFFWFPFLGSLPSLLTSLPPPLLYIFMFLTPFLSFLCPHLTFPLLTSPHILHPLLSYPSFHPYLISPCYLTFLYLHFLSLISFNSSSSFHIFLVFFSFSSFTSSPVLLFILTLITST